MRHSLLTMLLVTACTLGSAQAPQQHSVAPRGRALERGVLVRSVPAEANPGQSYALYLPSTYKDDRLWPIVYVFDPGAVGSRPLELMKDAAERYGYILAGSNNSRNGPTQPEVDAAKAMWSDTHSYLAIDDQRAYFAGFSGAARLASYLAQSCNCARAVFLNGGALMPGTIPVAQRAFAAFSIAGLGDFNYGELLQLDSDLELAGQSHFLRRFDGEHQWAPATVWEEAFAWSALLEMKNKLRSRDGAFIDAEFAKSNERIKKQLDAGEAAYALHEARAVAAIYEGLTDTSALKQQIAKLEKDPSTRARAKQEKADFEKQRALGNELFAVLSKPDNFTSGHLDVSVQTAQKVRQLRQDYEREKNPGTRRIYQRVLGNLFIMCMETGGPLLQKGEASNAQPYFEIAAEARPDWAWPFLSLARCHVAKGDKKATFRDLKRALETGSSVQDLTGFMKQDPKLAVLMDTEDYRKLTGDEGKGSPAK